MAYQIERPSPCRVALSATISAEEVRKEREHVLAEFLRGARIDGFRKGKAPRSLVERRFAGQIRDELEDHVIRSLFREVMEAERLRPASPLGIKESRWLEGGEFSVNGELEVFPTVELPPLDGFTPPPYDLSPTEEEVAQATDALRERQAAWEPVEDEVAADGMLVEAEVDGSYPDGGHEPFHEDRSLFKLGSTEVYPEIERAVLGKKVDETVAAERVLGEEASEERRGARVAYQITLKSLRRKRLPEVDDAFAASMGIEGGLTVFRERLDERIRLQKREQRRSVWRDALVRFLSGDRVIDLPESVVVDETRKEMLDFARALAARGIDPEHAKVDWKKLEPEMRQRVEHRLHAEVVLDALADSLHITVPASEVDREVEVQAKQLGVPFAELRGNLAKGGGLERIRAIIRRDHAADQILKRFVEGS